MMFGLLIIPLLTSAICFGLKNRTLIGYASLAGALSLGAWAAPVLWRAITAPSGLEQGFMFMDAFSAYVAGMVVMLAAASAMYSVGYIEHEAEQGLIDLSGTRRYYGLFHLFIFTMLVVLTTADLAVMWIGIEATTIVSAMLIGLGYQKRALAIEAAWKYLILCTVGITFALLGIFIAYYAVSATAAEPSLDWRRMTGAAAGLNPATMKLAFIFVLLGYGTKAGLAPVHNWLPDAHSEAPSPISALLSGVLLNTSLYGIIRFSAIVSPSTGTAFTGKLLIAFGLISIGVAALFMLFQDNYKRLLAYSSIEHMGIVCMGFGIGGPIALYGAVLHMLNHAIAKPLMFFTSGKIQAYYGSTRIDKIRGVLSAHPVWGTLTFIGVLALAGSPPFNIFISEFTVVSAGAKQGKWVVVGLTLFFLFLVFYGLLASFGRMLFGADEASGAVRERPSRIDFPTLLSASAMLGLGAAVIALGFYIPDFLDSALWAVMQTIGGRPWMR